MLSMHPARSGEFSQDGECHSPLEFCVCSSFNGFYVGTYCDADGSAG